MIDFIDFPLISIDNVEVVKIEEIHSLSDDELTHYRNKLEYYGHVFEVIRCSDGYVFLVLVDY